MRKKISQAEAWGMKHKIRLMEERESVRNNAYAQEWPKGVQLVTLNVDAVSYAKLKTARRLGYAIVSIVPNDGQVVFYAVNN